MEPVSQRILRLTHFRFGGSLRAAMRLYGGECVCRRMLRRWNKLEARLPLVALVNNLIVIDNVGLCFLADYLHMAINGCFDRLWQQSKRARLPSKLWTVAPPILSCTSYGLVEYYECLLTACSFEIYMYSLRFKSVLSRDKSVGLQQKYFLFWKIYRQWTLCGGKYSQSGSLCYPLLRFFLYK